MQELLNESKIVLKTRVQIVFDHKNSMTSTGGGMVIQPVRSVNRCMCEGRWSRDTHPVIKDYT